MLHCSKCVLLCIIIVDPCFHHLAITVTFSQSTYNFDEDAGPAQPVLVLSNPSSTDITVQVRDNQNTATSE